MPTADYSSYHQPPGTGGDGTKFDNFIDAVQATVNGLDKNNLAASAGILASQLADPTTGKVLGSSGSACAAVFPPGYSFDYKEYTSPVSVTNTAIGSADVIVTADAVTFDGATVVWVEFFAPRLDAVSSQNLSFYLFDGSTSLGRICDVGNSGNIGRGFAVGRRRLTPAAAAKTYSIRALNTGAGTATVTAGSGGATASDYLPGYISITKAG